MEFSVCYFNVRGLGNKVKREQLFTWLRVILCKYGASYIGTISHSDSDFDETC